MKLALLTAKLIAFTFCRCRQRMATLASTTVIAALPEVKGICRRENLFVLPLM